MTYLDDWKLCKKTFEAKAGKKPSEAFFGVFRRSTGMEDAAKALDAAQKNLDAKEIARRSPRTRRPAAAIASRSKGLAKKTRAWTIKPR